MAKNNMAINATQSTGGSFEPVPAGSVAGRIYQIVELGHIPGWQGKIQHKVRIVWELPKHMKEFKEGEGEKPMSIGKAYTLSTHEKAALRDVIEAGIGTTLTDGEAQSFDVESLIGKTMLLNIKHKDKQNGDGKYAYIDSVAELPEEMKIADAINEPVIFSLSSFDAEVFNRLPEFIQKDIQSSEEYQKRGDTEELDPDSIPF